MSRRIAALLIMGISFAVEGAYAQESSFQPAVEVTSPETRTEIIRQEQADKLRTVTPPELSRAEKIVRRLEDWGLLTGEPRGVYPVLDSVYPGGGFAAGLGARKPFGDDGAISVIGAYSINSFWRAQTDVSLPSFASNRGRVSLTAGYLDAPDVKYYGIGQDSNKDDKTFFGYTPFGGGGRLDFDVSRYLSVGGGVKYLDIETDSGASGPSIDDRFSPADTPGLELDQFKYVNSTARAVFDWRSRLGYAGSGGRYRVQFDDFRENDNDQYSVPFTRGGSGADDSADAGKLGHRPAGPYHGHRHRRHGGRSVFHAAVAGRGHYLAGLSGFPLPRSQPSGDERGTALDSVALPRHGRFL